MSQPNKTIVLMYHGIISKEHAAPEDRETGAELYDVSLDSFCKQLGCLRIHERAAVTLEGDSSAVKEGSVIITFDDGEMNNYHNAFAVLKELKYPAYFFVTVNRIGKKGYMGWEELKSLRDAGMVVGSHGLNHEIMTQLRAKDVAREFVESKAALEEHLKINVASFSVPRGFYDDQVIAAAREAGYRNVFVSGGPARTQEGVVGRLAVKGDWTVKRFEQALLGQTPAGEGMVNVVKGLSKRILGGAGYDRLRSTLLKKRKK